MPELPEVETMRRGAEAALGRKIAGVEKLPCRRRPIRISPRIDAFRRRAVGRRIEAVDRVGKRVLLRLESGDAIVLEPRMTGLVLVADPPTAEHLRLRIDLAGRGKVSRLFYWDRRGLGSVRLLSPAKQIEHFGPGRIGPDALAISAAELRSSLVASRRAVKVALLDQRAVAGIGNLYASEILFLAGIDPRAGCNTLAARHWTKIHAAMREVLSDAIRHEGSTLGDGTYRNALNQAGGYQNHHRVYDRAGRPCPVCAAPILRLVQAQRSTFFCRSCQR